MLTSNILIVLSGADFWTRADGTKYPTGYWAREFAVIHEKFVEAGCTVAIATPEGRKPTADPHSLDPGVAEPDTTRFAEYLESVSKNLETPLKSLHTRASGVTPRRATSPDFTCPPSARSN